MPPLLTIETSQPFRTMGIAFIIIFIFIDIAEIISCIVIVRFFSNLEVNAKLRLTPTLGFP